MINCYKNRPFLQDGNGFFDCVFTQSVENGCQNKESNRGTSPQTLLISWEKLISYQLPRFPSQRILSQRSVLTFTLASCRISTFSLIFSAFTVFYSYKERFPVMLIKVKVIIIQWRFLNAILIVLTLFSRMFCCHVSKTLTGKEVRCYFHFSS